MTEIFINIFQLLANHIIYNLSKLIQLHIPKNTSAHVNYINNPEKNEHDLRDICNQSELKMLMSDHEFEPRIRCGQQTDL